MTKKEGTVSMFGSSTPTATPIRHVFELDHRKTLLARSEMNEEPLAGSQYLACSNKCKGTWGYDAMPSHQPNDVAPVPLAHNPPVGYMVETRHPPRSDTTTKGLHLHRPHSSFVPRQMEYGPGKTFSSTGVDAPFVVNLPEARGAGVTTWAPKKLPTPHHRCSCFFSNNPVGGGMHLPPPRPDRNPTYSNSSHPPCRGQVSPAARGTHHFCHCSAPTF